MSLLSKLYYLVIQDNKLTGGIPPFLGNITSMEKFSACENSFSGSIPHSIFNLSLLVNLSLSENHLTGSLPSEIGFLEMGNNSFSGKLTIDFSKLRDIYLLRLQYNNFHARGEADDFRFVDSLKNCTKLVWLELVNCNLIGVLPISIGNIFQGIIPLSLSSLRGLEVFDISQNNLSGRIPQFLDKWVSLEFLDLSFNDFEGEVPIVGVFANTSVFSVLGNNKLYGGLVTLELPKCKEKGSKKT
ncbi:kinase-like domain-containing protein, partial [Tanacetum coccineum]